MKNLKKVIALVLCLITAFSAMSMAASAVSVSASLGYNEAENSGDWAQYTNGKVRRSSSTTVNEVKWMQAALNYCRVKEGLADKFARLQVDGSFGPKAKEATIAFQKAAGLTADGSFGPATIKKMKSVLNDGKDDTLKPKTVVAVTRPTTSTTTTQNTVSNNTFKQQNILQYYAPSSSNYISGDWYSYKNGKCTCESCNKKATTNANRHEYIQGGGCGIISLVSAIYNLGGTIEKYKIGTAIKEVFDWAYKNNHWKNAAYWSLLAASDEKFGEKYNFDVLETKNTYGCYGYKGCVNTDLTALVNHLKNNKGTAVVHVNNHYMAAVGYKVENGVEKIHIFDPSPGGRRGNYTDKTDKDGAWVELSVLKEGSVKNYLNHKKYLNTVSQENIEIDGYWLISKK